MKNALITTMLLLSVSIFVFLIATIVVRFLRTIRDKRLLRIRGTLRKTLIRLASGDLTGEELQKAVHLKTTEFDVLSETMISKIKGEARELLVDFLESRGVIDEAIRRTHRKGAMGRCKAASFLGNVGIKRARESLERLLDDHNSEVRSTAVRGLGLIGDPRSIPALLSRLDRSRDTLPFGAVIVAIKRMGPIGSPQVREGLAGEGEWQRAAAAELLGLLGALEAVPALITHLTDETSFEVRIRCARALGRIGSPKAIRCLVRSLRPDVPVGLRIVSCGALGQMGDSSTVVPIARFLNEDNAQISRAAANALIQIGGNGISALKACVAANNDGSPFALEALVRSETKEGRNDLPSTTVTIQ